MGVTKPVFGRETISFGSGFPVLSASIFLLTAKPALAKIGATS
jgi:hypothetical protein